VLTTDRPGGDFMVDVIKSLDFEYVAANPGSSFRGIHESIVNYGGNTAPEFITCCHEESSVAMAHGYFKAEGKPMAVLCHGTVGMQHAAMAIYNAYCDRVPVYIMAATRSTRRCGGPAWNGRTACRTRRRWFAISSSGTICRSRCRISPSRRCAPTRSR
jgi:thiamine pyrophosphate-dependent acetolactate synthase large subunit-like protein